MKTVKQYKRVWFLFAIAYFSVGYLLLNWYNSTRTSFVDVSMKLDHELPFVPLFIFGYLLVYATILGIYFLIDDKRVFKIGIRTCLIMTTIHYLFFYFVPVNMALRANVEGMSGFLNGFVHLYYLIDMPYNCFPSLHVAYTFVGTLILWNYKRNWAYIYFICSIIVALSVVFVKQHYISDVIGGYITPFISYYIACKITKPAYKPATITTGTLGGEEQPSV